jgi:hypothetical protein
MDQKSRLVLGTVCALLCGLCLPNSALGAALPEGKGKVEFVHNCTACHLASMVTRVKKTPEEWRKSVDEMASRGTDGTKEDLDNVVLYLVTNYGADGTGKPAADPGKPAEGGTPQAAAPPSITDGASAMRSPLDSLRIERVRRMLSESARTLPSNQAVLSNQAMKGF